MIIDERGYHLHQSDIETFMQCPEQLRLKHLAVGDATSDAAFVGTTTHAVIEHELMSPQPYGSLKEAINYGAYAFLEGMEQLYANQTAYSRETFKTDSKALKALEPLVESWYVSPERDMLMSMDPNDYQVEWEFDKPFTVTPDGTTIWLAGRTDLVLRNRVWDWKTSSSEYKPWEKQRWAIQPTEYLWAAATEGLILPNADGEFVFEYKVLKRGAKPVKFQTVTVKRTMGSFTWLERIVQNMVSFMEKMGFDTEWPLNDHSALCGPKWCPFWAGCKGAYIGEDWT